MTITFNPPLGETISLTTYALLPQKQINPLLFTAQINACEYAQISNDGGHLELWSDIPREGNDDGTWTEQIFLEEEAAKRLYPDAYILSLRTIPLVSDNQVHSLYLLVHIPPLEDGVHRIFFTYRIVYSSGRITWLGAFGQNGCLVLHPSESRVLKGIVLPNTWSLDSARRCYFQRVEERSCIVEVMKLGNPTEFRIWALGRDRVMTDLRGASVVILVPDTTKCFLALCPTYILTASAGTKISVSVDGSVNVSGPGTICLQANDSTREPESFMRQIFRDNNLDGWNVVASDAQRQFVVFSPAPSTFYPAHVIGIPLWSTYHLKPVLKLASSSLAHGIEQPGLEEFAVIRRDQSQLHIFNLDPAASRMIYLEFDTAGNDFVITPIYRLHIKESNILRSCWGAAALIQHRSIPAPFLPCNPNTLPTPSPSPPLPQIVSIVAGPSADNLTLSSVEEIRRESHERPEGPDQTELQAEPHISLGKDPTFSVLREANVWVFRYIVASFNALIRILFGHILWSHRTKRSSSQVKEQSQNKVNTTSLTNDVVENAAGSKNGFQQQQQTKEQISSNETPAVDTTTVTKINTESTEQSSDYPDLLAPTHDVELGHFCPSTSLDKGTDNFYAELLLSAQDHLDRVGYKLGSVDIVLIPLPSEDATSENLIDHAAASTDTSLSLKTELEGAMSSIDERGPLTCTFTQLQTFFANPGHSERLNPITFISYLVRYQLALGANGNSKSFSISSPLEGGV